MHTRPHTPPLGPLLRRVVAQQAIGPAADLMAEHAALVRWLGQLQRRMGALQLTHQQQVAALEASEMRLRAQVVMLRTATLWGLGEQALSRPLAATRATGPQPPAVWREASAVICQTGCQGHGHPWLDGQGGCRRTGQVCQSGARAGEAAARPDGSAAPGG